MCKPVRLLTVVLLVALAGEVRAQGLLLPAAGAVNRGMGSASTAAPLDAIGSLYWNPATISALPGNMMDFSVEMLGIDYTVSSTAGAATGSTDAEFSVAAVPNFGLVYRQPDSHMTFGFSMNAIGGFGTNLRQDASNPILAAKPGGLGRVYTSASLMTMNPVVAIALDDQLSVAIGPTIAMAQLGFGAFAFDAPNTNGLYGAAPGQRFHYGGGMQAGVYYIANSCYRFGAVVKSPIWFERFRFLSEDATGMHRLVKTDINLPMVISLGMSAQPREDLLWALDLRYHDYANTKGFGDPAAFAPSGAVTGTGWASVMSAAFGVQKKVNDAMYLRMGYIFTQRVMSDAKTFFNVGSHLFWQHVFSAGASVNLAENFSVSMAYAYIPSHSATGPIHAPGVGPVAGTSITGELDYHILTMQTTVRF